ncbi:MAG TPA: hypothetical protein VIN39_04915 [Candidatus Dormibacteraeota bacterium]|jgi:ABC-type glycerol-3-phosphate transport system substrate-binding protein
MRHKILLLVAALLLVTGLAACGTGADSGSGSGTTTSSSKPGY